jgi:hypothetical protein
VTTEEKTAAGDAAARARQGQDGEMRAKCSNSGNTELRNASPAPAGPARRRRRTRRRSRLPKRVLRVTIYKRLSEYLAAFAAGHFHLLILVGTGGLAKSRSVRAILGGQGCWIEGNATPFGMYVKLFHHKDEFVVIDDVDALYADRSGVRLLKCLCQTEEEKTVAWHSDARSLERQRIPREFTTKSREVHREAGKWFDDAEIYRWFGENLHQVREPSLRHYVRARELKAAGMDWTAVLAAEDDNRRARLAAEILESDEYASTAARVAAFVAQGGGCRATFFNYRRLLQSGGPAKQGSYRPDVYPVRTRHAPG